MEDFFMLDETLPESACMVRDSTRRWVKERLMPTIIAECYMAGRFPMELVPEMAEQGCFGIKTDPEYGGSGSSNYEYGIMCREIEAGDSGVRSFMSVQNSLVMYPIEKFGSQEQKDHWLRLLAEGKAIGAFGFTDPASGSDPASMNMHVRPDGSDYILSGSGKQWITNGTIANFVIMWAKLKDKVLPFIVERGTSGFETHEIDGKLSLRASNTASIFCDDVRIPMRNLLPGARGISSAYECLNEARFGIAHGMVGAAQFCFETATEYAGPRKSFGKSIAAHPLVQERLVWMRQKVEDSRLRIMRVTALKEDGKVTPEHISYAKRANVRDALEVARMARALLGGNGITIDYHVMRHLCNLETVLTYEGTKEMHILIEGAGITGIKAFD